jgi:ABC-type glycerol-3-phosphate transport system substrate-binding protein
VNRAACCSLGAAILLCSCTGDDESAGAGDGPTPTATYSGALTTWFLDPGSAAARAAVQSAVDAFGSEHPGVTVRVEFVPWAEGRDRLTAAVAASEAPDLAQTSTAWTAELAAEGSLAPAAPADGFEYVASLVDSGAVSGTSYGYPWFAQAQALLYRTDVLAQADVSAPATWEEVFSVGDTIMAEVPDVAPMQVGGNHLDLQAPLLWAAGGDIATQVAGVWKSGVDSAAGREAFSHFESVWKKGWSPRGAVEWTPDDVRTAFADGRSAMMIGGLADLRAVIAANPGLAGEISSALLPAGPGGNRDAVVSGTHLVVLDSSAQQEAAAALARHLTTPEQSAPVADAVEALPGTHEGIEMLAAGDAALTAFGEQLVDHSRTYPAAVWWQEVVSAGAFEAATQRLMQGRITAHEAAARVDAAIRGAIG